MEDGSVKPKVINISLNARARDIIDRIRDDTGIPNTEAAARIFEWFAGLDRKLRLAVLTRDDDTRRELTRLVLTEMAGLEPGTGMSSSEIPATADQAAQIAHLMVDRLRQIGKGRGRELAERHATKKK